jgi:hypothetical protein
MTFPPFDCDFGETVSKTGIKVTRLTVNDAAQSPVLGHGDRRPVRPARACNPPATVFCGAAGEALKPAEHPFNNLSALRASNLDEANLKYHSFAQIHYI